MGILVPHYVPLLVIIQEPETYFFCRLFTCPKQKWLFGGPAFFQPIRSISKAFKNWNWLEKAAL